MSKENDVGFTQRVELLVRPDMDRAIDILAQVTGGNRSSIIRMVISELLDAKLPGWRDPAFQALSTNRAALEAQRIQSAQQRKTRGAGRRSID